MAPWGRRVLSHHGVGVKAFLIFPEILEAKESVRTIDQRPLRVTTGTKLGAEEDNGGQHRGRGESKGSGVAWMGDAGWRLAAPSARAPLPREKQKAMGSTGRTVALDHALSQQGKHLWLAGALADT